MTDMKTITEPIGNIMRDLSKLAEDEIERQLTEVCLSAIEQRRGAIVEQVTKKYKMSCTSALVQLMDSSGMALQFSFTPKTQQEAAKK